MCTRLIPARRPLGALLPVAVFLLAASASVCMAREAGPTDKLMRGLKNMALAPVDIPATMDRMSRETNVLGGVTVGLVEGVLNAGVRELAGLLEVVLSPFPNYGDPLYHKALGERSTRRYPR